MGRTVQRFLSAIAFLVTLVAVLGAAGCGDRFARGPGEAPASGDLAADALAALQAKGSAHFVSDIDSTLPGGVGSQLSVHAEGDASATAMDASASVGFGGLSLTGRVMVDEHNLFIQFMNQWYGERQGIRDALGKAKDGKNAQVWNEIATPEGLRHHFDQLFSGGVAEGPVVDGVATWRFQGHLNAEGLADFAKRLDSELTDAERVQLDKVASASKLVLVVGQEDHLPRRVEFGIHLTAADLKAMQDSDSSTLQGAENFESTLELSDFGKPVEVTAPPSFKPLDALFEQLFSGLE
jgi:hypothetical protein